MVTSRLLNCFTTCDLLKDDLTEWVEASCNVIADGQASHFFAFFATGVNDASLVVDGKSPALGYNAADSWLLLI